MEAPASQLVYSWQHCTPLPPLQSAGIQPAGVQLAILDTTGILAYSWCPYTPLPLLQSPALPGRNKPSDGLVSFLKFVI